jgi:DNA transposition AAA+ family ATPase
LRTAKGVMETLDYCVDLRTIAMISARFGAGKTEAVRYWRRMHPAQPAVNFEFDQYNDSNKVLFIKALAGFLGVRAYSASGGEIFESVVAHLKQSPALLIFDQCETVRPHIFQVIRQIHDRTREAGVSVAILAAPNLLARMSGSKAADLEALRSRVGVWAELPGVLREELIWIVRDEGIADIDDAALELLYKAVGGSMRYLSNAIDLMKREHAGKRVTERTIAGIASKLWGLTIHTPRPIAVKAASS